MTGAPTCWAFGISVAVGPPKKNQKDHGGKITRKRIRCAMNSRRIKRRRKRSRRRRRWWWRRGRRRRRRRRRKLCCVPDNGYSVVKSITWRAVRTDQHFNPRGSLIGLGKLIRRSEPFESRHRYRRRYTCVCVFGIFLSFFFFPFFFSFIYVYLFFFYLRWTGS